MVISKSFQFLLPICCALFTFTSASVRLDQAIAEPSQPSVGTTVKQKEGDLENTSWTLTSWFQAPWRENYPLSSSQITLKFAAGKVTGKTGCNNYQGEYQLVGELLKASELKITRQDCPKPLQTQQTRFLRTLLQADNTVILSKDKRNLTLISYIKEAPQTQGGGTTQNNRANGILNFRSQPTSPQSP